MNDWALRLRDLEFEKRDLKRRVEQLEAELAALKNDERDEAAEEA